MLKLKPWADTLACNWANVSDAIILSNMDQCIPASALSEKLKRNHWKVFPYETTDGIAGNIIWASIETHAPSVRLPLNVNGWYAIFIGLFNGTLTPCLAWLKLDSDVAAQARRASRGPGYWNIEEAFFKAAEIKEGTHLEISQQVDALSASVWQGMNLGCGVAYVKLIPLTDDEIAGIQADRSGRSNRRLAATCDGSSYIADYRPTTTDGILREIELFKDTDVGTLLLHLGGSDHVGYLSKHGTAFGQAVDDYPDVGMRYHAEGIRAMKKANINPTRVLIDGAHSAGMKVHVGIRPALWSYYEPFADIYDSPFYMAHPEWRTVDRDGTPVSRMSWAAPEVRTHLVEILREAVEFGADGAHIVFNRGFPLTLYEAPFVELFQRQYGEDPRDIDESDPRITNLRSDIVTMFMQELRAMLDEEQIRRDSAERLEISVCVLSNEYDNLQYGVDLRRLVADGLLDKVYPTRYPGDFGAKQCTWDFQFFMDICSPKNVPVIPIYTFAQCSDDERYTAYAPPGGFVSDVLSLYDQGAAGIGYWDVSYEYAPRVRLWTPMSRFGHIDELKSQLGTKFSDPVFIPVHRLGAQIVDGRFPPYWGG